MKFQPGDIHKAVSQLLSARLQPLITSEGESKRDLNPLACVEIYSTIFETLVEVVQEAQLPVTNEGMNYLAQQYYDGILINETHELDPEIFTQRAKLENMETKELALLAVMLSGTDFALPVLAEIKKRQ